MVPHAGDPYFLPRIIPFHRLNEIALLSDQLTSADLEGWGLLNRVVDAAEVLPTALELRTPPGRWPDADAGPDEEAVPRSLSVDMATSFERSRRPQR